MRQTRGRAWMAFRGRLWCRVARPGKPPEAARVDVGGRSLVGRLRGGLPDPRWGGGGLPPPAPPHTMPRTAEPVLEACVAADRTLATAPGPPKRVAITTCSTTDSAWC